MRPQKPIKVDLNNEYPCPCRRRGRLLPIILTEAFGCELCQQIFVLQENSQVIEQLSSSYPYKRMWRWTGYRWLIVHPPYGENYFLVVLGIILLLFIGLAVILKPLLQDSTLLSLGILVMLVVLPAILIWLAYRR